MAQGLFVAPHNPCAHANVNAVLRLWQKKGVSFPCVVSKAMALGGAIQMMSRVKNGLVAGFIATAVVSVLEAINVYLVKMFDPFPGVVAKMIGMPGNMAMGWVMHGLIGTVVLGIAFALLYDRLPTRTPAAKGIAFAIGAWVLMMLYITMVIPQQRALPSGGFEIVAWMLVTHAVFGVVLGTVYHRLLQREKAHSHPVGAAPAH